MDTRAAQNFGSFNRVGAFRQLEEVETAYLFGSEAISQSGPVSDVDIAVVFDKTQLEPGLPQSRRRLEMIVDLKQLLPGREVDLVLLDKTSPLFAHRIVRDGVVVKETEPQKRTDREEKSIHRYIDTKPLRQKQWALHKMPANKRH